MRVFQSVSPDGVMRWLPICSFWINLTYVCRWTGKRQSDLSIREDKPPTITVLEQEVAVGLVEEFVYLSSLIHSTTQGSPDISRHSSGYAESRKSDLEVQNLNFHQIEAYSTCILTIFLYSSECWAVTKSWRCTQDRCSRSTASCESC